MLNLDGHLVINRQPDVRSSPFDMSCSGFRMADAALQES
jgi:hypothetical protein